MKAKSIICIAAAALLSIPALAQIKVTQYSQDVSSFNVVDVSQQFEVSVVRGDNYSVNFTVDEPFKDYVNCSVSESKLFISVDEKKVSNDVKKMYKGKGAPEPTFRAVITTPTYIHGIYMHDKSVFFEARDVMAEDDVTIFAAENAQIKTIVIASQNVNVELDKKANATLTITANKLVVNTAGNSICAITADAKECELNTKNASQLTVDGTIDIYKVNAAEGSKLNLSGTAPEVSYTCNGKATVNADELKTENAFVSMAGGCNLSIAPSRSIKMNLAKGSTLTFTGDPIISIEAIKSASVIKK